MQTGCESKSLGLIPELRPFSIRYVILALEHKVMWPLSMPNAVQLIVSVSRHGALQRAAACAAP